MELNKKIMASLASIGGMIIGGNLINYKTNQSAVSEHLLSYVAEDFFEWKNCKIYFKKYGTTGKPVLLLHDLFAAGNAEEWSQIIPNLAKNHRVYVIDMLGCGRSDKPAITYTFFHFVEIIRSFIKSVICEKTFVIASSNSSQIALIASAYDNTLFSGFILLNPPSIEKTGKTPNPLTKLLMRTLKIPALGTLIYQNLFSKKNLEMRLRNRFYDPTKITNKMLQTCLEAAHLENGNGRFLEASIIGRYVNMDIRHALQKITLPISIYYSASYKNKESIARSWKHHQKKISLTKLSRTGLYPHLETPERISALIEISIHRSSSSH